MKKRAVSQVVAAVLIIFITVAAISLLWFVVLPLLNSLSSFNEDVSLEILSEGYTAWDSDNRLAEIQIKRGVDEAKIVGFKLIFELENDNLYYIVDEVINFNEKKVYNFNFTNYSSYGELLVVKLIAVYEGGSESGVLSELKIKEAPKKDLSTKTPSGGYISPSPSGSGGGSSGGGSGGGSSEEPEEEPEEECIPLTCSDFEGCGTFDNNCEGTIYCGCEEGYECIDSICVPLNEEVIFVDQNIPYDCIGNYSIANRDCSGEDGDAYNTLQEATNIAVVGDNIEIREGNYNEVFKPINSGSPSNPIEYKSYSRENVVIRGIAYDERAVSHPDDPNYYYGPVWLEDKEYIIVDGINFTSEEGFGRITRSDFNIFKNCNFFGPTSGWIIGLNIFESHSNKFLNNSFSGASDNFRIIHSNNNVIEGNNFNEGRHVLLTLKCSSNNVIRNNYFYNELQKAVEVLDCEQPTMFDHYNIPYYQDTEIVNNSKYNLIEGNTFAYTAPDNGDGPFNHIQYAGQLGIIRNNLFYDSNGISLGMSIYGVEASYNINNRIYNNVFYNNLGGIVTSRNYGEYPIYDNIFLNNIIFKNTPIELGWADNHLSGSQISHRAMQGFLFKNNNIINRLPGESDVIYDSYNHKISLQQAQTTYPNLYIGNIETIPQFIDEINHNFNLQSTSPMIDAGDFLTKTTSAGSGTIMQVEDVKYFYDGFGISGEVGDVIRLENGGIAKVTDVNYETNRLTLNTSLSWDSGQRVSLFYYGNAPDIGSYESYKTGECVPSKTCLTYLSLGQCGVNLSDGCNDILNCLDCGGGKVCLNNECIEAIPCSSDTDCNSLNGECKIGKCSQNNICYEEYLEERTPCSAGMCHNGKCVECILNNDCPEGENCAGGVCFDENQAFSFLWLGDDNQGAAPYSVNFAYTEYPDIEVIFYVPDLGRDRVSDFNEIEREWKKNPNANPLFTPLFIGLGNHDVESINTVNQTVEIYGSQLSSFLPGMNNFREGPYVTYPNGYQDRNTTYSFDYKNVHFIMWNVYSHDLLLDPPQNRFEEGYTPIGCVNEEVMQWLEEDLSNTNATFKFIFYHEGAHPVPRAGHEGDSLDYLNCPGNYIERSWANQTRPMRERFWSLLAKYNVTAAFKGHDHANTLTWVNDIYEGNGALYEIESGIPNRLAVVNIKGDNATLRLYDIRSEGGTAVLFEPFGPVVLNKDEINHSPKIYQHLEGIDKGFPVIEERDLTFEVGQALPAGSTKLCFEAKDNDIEDKISFSFNNLPSFLVANGLAIPYSYGTYDGTKWEEQYRRILLWTKTENNNKLTEEHIGEYNFDIIASDGQLQDEINMNISVLPAAKPKLLGATIPNNSVIHFPMNRDRIYFFCQDDESGPSVPRYGNYIVQYNGEQIGCCSVWHSYSGSTFSNNLVASEFIIVDDSDNVKDVLPGKYDVTVYCSDGAGHKSDNYSLTFYLSNGSDDTPISNVYGSWPASGATVDNFERISFWSTFTPTRSLIQVKKDGNLLNDYELVTSSKNGSALSWGTFALIFNSTLTGGLYEFDINGSVLNVTLDESFSVSSFDERTSDSGIWDWIVNLITGKFLNTPVF
ncbi:MAG: hypothetical protein WC494_01975 [Candidatus Pacearchaeota archaeon]